MKLPTEKVDLVVIGGGAAGFFSALAAKERSPKASVLLIEKNAALLSKVRISGGGRCNVTHNCFDPKELVKNYPRGHKELLGPLHQFQPQDTVNWFQSRGVELKAEKDGRMFPITDNSQTIIDCLMKEALSSQVEILTRLKIAQITKNEDVFILDIQEGSPIQCKALILATGSSSKGYEWAQNLGHSLVPAIPSLFTFNSPTSALKELSGIAFSEACVQIKGTSLSQKGPVLITHFGFSGPAVLKLSAWAALELHERQYHFDIIINWLTNLSFEEIKDQLHDLKQLKGSKKLVNENLFKLPKKFWKACLENLGISLDSTLHNVSTKALNKLAQNLHAQEFKVEGKTTHKEEFVTCGGVSTKEVDFKTMQSKVCQNLYFAGEILNIDGITGGFNFQNAWTTGYIAGRSSMENIY